jgi:hypothetical protein
MIQWSKDLGWGGWSAPFESQDSAIEIVVGLAEFPGLLLELGEGLVEAAKNGGSFCEATGLGSKVFGQLSHRSGILFPGGHQQNK